MPRIGGIRTFCSYFCDSSSFCTFSSSLLSSTSISFSSAFSGESLYGGEDCLLTGSLSLNPSNPRRPFLKLLTLTLLLASLFWPNPSSEFDDLWPLLIEGRFAIYNSCSRSDPYLAILSWLFCLGTIWSPDSASSSFSFYFGESSRFWWIVSGMGSLFTYARAEATGTTSSSLISSFFSSFFTSS